MKLKVQSLLTAFAVSVVLVPAIQAQTDITDQYLNNPGFEYAREGELYVDTPEFGNNKGPVRGDPYGWSRSGELVGNSWGINQDAANFIGGAMCWYNSSPFPDLLEVYQEIEGLPAGDYLVTCKLAIFADRISDQRLFANNNVQYFMSEDALVNIPKMEGEVDQYAGLIPTNPGDLANLQGMLVMTTLEEGQSLKLGIRASNYMTNGERNSTTNYGWFKMDDFKLYHLENGIIGYYKARLQQVIDRAEGLDMMSLPLGDYYAIQAVKEEAQQVYDTSDDPEEVGAEVAKMEEKFAEIELSMASWEVFINLLSADYPALVALDYSGLEEFKKAYIVAMMIKDNEASKKEDIDKAIEDFRVAIDVYKYTGFEQAEINNPFEASWYLKDPSFDNWEESTTLELFWHMTTGDQYKLTKHFVEIWADHAKGLTLPNSYAYQLIEDIPNGIYDLEASMIACNQGYAHPSDFQIEGVSIMANTSTNPVSTQQDPETYNQGSPFKVRTVVTDGKLMAGILVYGSNASWAAIDDLKLTYYGNKDLATYQEIYTDQLNKAKGMLDRDILPEERKALEAAIQAAESAAPSTVQMLETSIGNLSAAIWNLQEAERKQAAFKAASFQKALVIVENSDNTYTQEVIGLITTVVVDVLDLLSKDTTTIAVYPVLTENLDKYLSFVDAYQALNAYKLEVTEDALADLISEVLSSQVLEVAADIEKIEEAKALFTPILSFAKTYEVAVACIHSDKYPESAIAKLIGVINEQLTETKADYTYAPKGERAMMEALGEMRFTGLVPGEDTEVTELTIVNPTVDADDNNAVIEGWTINKGVGNTFSNTGQHWSAVTTDRYLDSYHGTGGALKYTAKQEIKGVPNGTYKLMAAVRSHGNGAYLYAVGGGEVFKTEIINGGDKGGSIWEDAEEGSPIKEINNGQGRGWNWMEVSDINVDNYTITIGVSTDDAVTGGNAYNGWWFSADDFKLFYVSEEFRPGVGLEDINADNAQLIVYAEDGYIKVEGEETYTVTTLSGVQVSPYTQLTPGIYIVKAGAKSAKVMVK